MQQRCPGVTSLLTIANPPNNIRLGGYIDSTYTMAGPNPFDAEKTKQDRQAINEHVDNFQAWRALADSFGDCTALVQVPPDDPSGELSLNSVKWGTMTLLVTSCSEYSSINISSLKAIGGDHGKVFHNCSWGARPTGSRIAAIRDP